LKLVLASPCDGEIVAIVPEQHSLPCFGGVQGFQVHIVPRERPDVHVRIFHVNPSRGPGAVRSGERIGHADLRSCYGGASGFDVSIEKIGGAYSYFEWLEDGPFSAWVARGLAARGDAVITQAARDADPCVGGDFGYQQCGAETIVLAAP
jgi:hypothetical protein